MKPESLLILYLCRTLSCGQRGEVFEVNGDQVAVIFDLTGKASKEDRMLDPAVRSSIYWISGTYSSLERLKYMLNMN